MGRGSKEGSGQKTRGERQQLSLQQALITLTTDEEPEVHKSFRTPSLRFCPLHSARPQGLAAPASGTAPHGPSLPQLSGELGL